MAAIEDRDSSREAVFARGRFMLLWTARLMLAVFWLLVVSGAVSSEGIAGLLAWYVLAATAVFVIACIRELAGGLLLIAFCLLYAGYGTYSLWEENGFAAGYLTGALITGFGNIYVLIAYATMALPGGMLVLSWYLGRKLGNS